MRAFGVTSTTIESLVPGEMSASGRAARTDRCGVDAVTIASFALWPVAGSVLQAATPSITAVTTAARTPIPGNCQVPGEGGLSSARTNPERLLDFLLEPFLVSGLVAAMFRQDLALWVQQVIFGQARLTRIIPPPGHGEPNEDDVFWAGRNEWRERRRSPL